MVRGTSVSGKISVKIGGKVNFKDKNGIKVPNVDEICNGDYETPCSLAFCSVTEVTSFSGQAVGCSDGHGLLYVIIIIHNKAVGALVNLFSQRPLNCLLIDLPRSLDLCD